MRYSLPLAIAIVISPAIVAADEFHIRHDPFAAPAPLILLFANQPLTVLPVNQPPVDWPVVFKASDVEIFRIPERSIMIAPVRFEPYMLPSWQNHGVLDIPKSADWFWNPR